MTKKKAALTEEEIAGLAQSVGAFAELVNRCNVEYAHCASKLGEVERLRNDLMHFIELDGDDYPSRCKWATQLHRCLLDRRRLKDRMELLYPIAVLSMDKNHLYANLSCATGQVRQVINRHTTRTYHPRVLASGKRASATDAAPQPGGSEPESDDTEEAAES